jgi:cytochrome c-type biogenesis protein CcmF
MSSPILTGLIGKASQVDISFYNKVNLPVAIAMSLLLGVTPFLGWSSEEKSAVIKRLSMSLLLTALSCVIAYVAGVTSTMLLLFAGSSAFGLISNVIIAFRQYRSGWMMLGGPVSHIGVGLLLIGILGSGNFDESKKVVLKSGQPQSVHGYTFTLKDISETPNLRTQVNIEVVDGKNIYQADPKLYFSEYNQSMLREPDIKIFPLKDIYISPLELKEAEHQHEHPTIEVVKGRVAQYGQYSIEFVQFQTGMHGQSGGMSVGASLKVTVDGVIHELMPLVNMNERGERESVPVDLPRVKDSPPNTHPEQMMITGMNVEQKKILLQFSGSEHHEENASYELLVDISTKPLMMVVWTGVVLIIGGSAIAFKRRLKNND